MQKKPQSVICLLGPTAVGKTAIACQLADQFPVDIISVDSSMVYQGMNIGTAKPTAPMLAKYPHQLIDICDVTKIYSVGNFIDDVIPIIQRSLARNRTPLLVGGTMMYFHALQFGLAKLPTANPMVRKQILAKANTVGWEHLHQEMAVFDPISHAKIKPTDSQRIQRAYEVFILTKQPISSFLLQPPVYNFTLEMFGLKPTVRTSLDDVIKERFATMLATGFLEEVETFFARTDVTAQLPAMRSVGYRQAWQYLANEFDYQTMVASSIHATKQLAKRQYTWLNQWKDLQILTSQAKMLYALQQRLELINS